MFTEPELAEALSRILRGQILILAAVIETAARHGAMALAHIGPQIGDNLRDRLDVIAGRR
jgi:hypothetical protein